jgi:hypothetical protein
LNDQSSNRFIDSLRIFVDIARLRCGPEDLPVNRALLAITILGYGLLNLVFSQLLSGTSGQTSLPVLPVLVEVAIALLWLALVLRLASRPERFMQTATAVFGFQLVVAPLFLAVLALFARYRDDPAWQVPVMVLVVAVGIWTLVVHARILVAATQWPAFLCMVLVLAEAFLGRVIVLALFPETGAAAPAA